MLRSMTGYGDARRQQEEVSVGVEVRAVNNRYLKVLTKVPDAYTSLEGDIEKLVRTAVTRGTVTVTVRVDGAEGESPYKLNRKALEEYWRQLNELAESIHVATPTDLGSLIDLPGAVTEKEETNLDAQAEWPLVRDALDEALEKLRDFRASEGQSMEKDLRENCRVISGKLDEVRTHAPQVVRDYRDRLQERVGELLEGTEVTLNDADVLREVSLFAERCDINEEVTRLASHLEQFDEFLDGESSQGRKLDFLSQEMFREVNTIGSKANNVEIAHCVVEMKAAIEKLREILQNVE